MLPAVRSRTAALAAALPAVLLAAVLGCSHPTSTSEGTSTEYDGTYAGPAIAPPRGPVLAIYPYSDSATVTLTLSQMGSALGGTLTIAQRPGGTYIGGVRGSTTGTGGVFTYVEAGYSNTRCPATLHGTFTINNGLLTGSAKGRDCNANGTDNVALTFTNLAKQP